MVKIKPVLPWGYDSLQPYISEEIIHYHFDKHHKGYADKYNIMMENEANEDISKLPLRQAVHKLAEEINSGNLSRRKVFENGAQIWNHDFLWQSMARGTSISRSVSKMIAKSFRDMDHFKSAFLEVGISCFGSGWLWILQVRDRIDLAATSNADAPYFNTGGTNRTRITQTEIGETIPLAVCDLWEHAYYLQYKNDRPNYLLNFFDHLINWDFVQQNVDKTLLADGSTTD